MNETILNGLINLFAIFASLAKIQREKARAALISYLTSHFSIRSNQEYMGLFDETQTIYDDPDFEIDKQMVILNVCRQLKPKLIAEEQLLLLLRFMEFAHGSNEGLDQKPLHLPCHCRHLLHQCTTIRSTLCLRDRTQRRPFDGD